MGKRELRKGRRAEYQVRDAFRGMGLECHRVPSSGSSRGFKGDLLLEGMFRVEVKTRKDSFRNLYRWLESNDILVVKADRKPPLAVMTLETLEKLLRRRRHGGNL